MYIYNQTNLYDIISNNLHKLSLNFLPVWHSKKKGLLAMGHGDDADVVGQEVGGSGGSGDIGWPLPASTFSSLLMTFCRRCCCCCFLLLFLLLLMLMLLLL